MSQALLRTAFAMRLGALGGGSLSWPAAACSGARALVRKATTFLDHKVRWPRRSTVGAGVDQVLPAPGWTTPFTLALNTHWEKSHPIFSGAGELPIGIALGICIEEISD